LKTEKLLNEVIPGAIRLIFLGGEQINRLHPDVLLVGNPNTHEGRILALLADEMKIPSATIIHGTIFANHWTHVVIDLICAWGEPNRRSLELSGFPSENVKVTGAPRFDELLDKPDKLEKNSILVATSGIGDAVITPDQHYEFIRILYETVELTPDVSWIVKLHRKDSEEHYLKVRPGGHPRVKIVKGNYLNDGLDIFHWLASSRAMVTISSTTALEAQLVNVPVIAVEMWPEGKAPSTLEFLHNNSVHKVRTAKELASLANKIWAGEQFPEVEKASKDYMTEIFPYLGSASDQAAQCIINLLKEQVNHGSTQYNSDRGEQ